jgi:hypothetical protein
VKVASGKVNTCVCLLIVANCNVQIILVWVSHLIMSVRETVFFLKVGPTLKPDCLGHFFHCWSTIKSLFQWQGLERATLSLLWYLLSHCSTINSLFNSWCKPIINIPYYLLNWINLCVGYGNILQRSNTNEIALNNFGLNNLVMCAMCLIYNSNCK